MTKFLLGSLLIFGLMFSSCDSGQETEYRNLNEEEALIWNIQSKCFSQYCDLSGLEEPLIRYSRRPCEGYYAGCAHLGDDGLPRSIEINPEFAFRGENQYPEFVPVSLNVELFMHEFLHQFADYCFNDGGHDSVWFSEDSLCPQTLWNDPEVWK